MGITYLHAVLLAKKADKGVVTVRLKRNQRSRTMINREKTLCDAAIRRGDVLSRVLLAFMLTKSMD
jgi:hypothetical protein